LGKYESREWTYVRKDGSRFPVQLIVSSIRNSAGEITGYLGVATDITERKHAEEKLRNYSILESKSKEMEQFAYIASHDLREPLLTIKSFAKLLDEEYGTTFDEDGRIYINAIIKSITRMEALTKGLLDYSRLGQIKPMEKVDCNAVLNDVVADLNALITTTGATVVVDKLPVVNGHALELKLLFQNLLNNAIKFRKKDIAPVVQISAKPTADGYLFAVEDNGIGISEKNREKIFVMFQRLHNRDLYEGTGIGLAQCKKIVEMHNGTIWVESEPDKYSRFCFTIST
jgi:light-regulated signal transduction histidine kinase (bacteriophytochrome)